MYFMILVFLVLHLSQVCLSVSAKSRDKNIAAKDGIIDVILKELHEVKQHLGQEISALQVQLHHEISHRKALETQLGETNKRISNLEHTQSPVYVDNNTLVEQIFQVPQIETPIAFAVRTPQAEAEDPGFEGTLLFQEIVTNLGDYYSSGTGQFTCPVSGLYFFSYNIRGEYLRDGQHFVSANLRVNGGNKWYASCYHYGSANANINCGATVVLQCESGSVVEVYKEGYDIHIGGFTWFTGFLIRPV